MIFPEGVFEPVIRPRLEAEGIPALLTRCLKGDRSVVGMEKVQADYVVLDQKRAPWILSQLKSDVAMISKNEFDEMIKKAEQIYDVVHEEDGFLILKRKATSPETKKP